jgi:hypothetical protein
MKVCKICRISKELYEFHKKADNKDGLFNYCKECFKSKQKTYYENNKEKILERTAKYEEKNKEARKAYRDDNRDVRRAKSKEYYWASKDRRKRINARRQNLKSASKYKKCQCCSKESLIEFYVNRPDNYQVDHILCASLGGYHCLKNLQYLSEYDHVNKSREERKYLLKST